MKELLENLSIALGHKGEINETVQTSARNMLASGMDYAEINAYAKNNSIYVFKVLEKTSENIKDLA
tara:strand:- start:61 stop:258 length:198 start_codon:yes stop_codon:yes gene_type:complete